MSLRPKSVNMCPKQMGTNSKRKERSILKISSLGLQLDFLASFRSYFAINEIAISVAHQPRVYFFKPWTGLKNIHPLELEGVTSAVDCVKCVPIPVTKQDVTSP